ncbi:MAG: hypothetical protein GY841_22700, partial [FCB group bacterium]|nr:hypothetical protein [FCB group bacterium]
LNRVTSKSYSRADPQVTYTYDNPAIPNGKGRLYSLSNTNVTTTYGGYDAMGRVTRVSKTIDGDQERTTLFAYDLSGKVTRLTYPDGFYIDHGYYPGTGLLHTLKGPQGETYAAYSDYKAHGTMGKVAHGNGTSSTFTYDPLALNITGIETRAKEGHGNAIQRRAYTYSAGGVLQELETDITAVYAAMTPINYTFEQNTLAKNKHALATAVADGITYNFNHDQNGNLLSGPD